MLTAKEARKIAKDYKSDAAIQTRKGIELLIEHRSKTGYFWMDYDYGFMMDEYGLTKEEKRAILYELRSNGFDVKDDWYFKHFIIRW